MFEKDGLEDGGDAAVEAAGTLPDDFDQLPIELVSLSDRFVLPCPIPCL